MINLYNTYDVMYFFLNKSPSYFIYNYFRGYKTKEGVPSKTYWVKNLVTR